MTLPPAFRTYLADPALTELWTDIRKRLERNGHSIEGSVRVELDESGAAQLSGLLGRRVATGSRAIALPELDTALLRSVAARGLVAIVAELTGGPLRDRPSERLARDTRVAELWSVVDAALVANGLANATWARPYVRWLHTSGLLVRAGERAAHEFDVAARALATLLDSTPPPRMLGELAAALTGDAHALDNDRLAGRLVLRALGFAFDLPDPNTPRARIALWERVSVSADTISGTVITWNLRPPGGDSWSAMMRARADLELITHLTLAELTRTTAALAEPGVIISACENPQVLQRAADIGVDSPLVCFSGNPASAGMALAERVPIRYHGDFDWPGVAIAARLFAGGAEPWRMSTADYLTAVDSGIHHIPLLGAAVETPWDPQLGRAMMRAGRAVHEEAVLTTLLDDLRSGGSTTAIP
ncbi:TIGR02679 family protein [Nocardia sp. NPDC057668]|uniref:TIGR02679 family protein n=1 Tax=Nocardia sp. NPDC057668 TaxID=3346202 RepID=UPI00366F9080